MFSKLTVILVLAAWAGTAAHASIYLEPYGGYSVGNINATPLVGNATEANLQGGAYGGRAGFMLLHTVFVTYDYQALAASERQTASTNTYTWKQNTPFLTLGLQMPFGLRIFGSYAFSTYATQSTTPNATSYTGTARKAGIGWQIMRHLAINLEYSIYDLKDSTVNGVTTPLATTYSKYTYTSTMVNLSIPFTFFHIGGGSGGGGHHSSSSGDSSNSPQYDSAPPSQPSY